MRLHRQPHLSHGLSKYAIHILLLFILLGLPEAAAPQAEFNPPAKSRLGQDMLPQTSFFSSLPVHLIGETVEAQGYSILLNQVRVQDGKLALDLKLVNNSEHPIDLNWAVKLYLPSEELVPPGNPLSAEENLLSPHSSLERTWYYQVDHVDSQTLSDWRLLYAPFGWSGPVILYRLTDTAPVQRVTPKSPAPANNYGTTGDPWKMLVLIYPNIDTDYVEGGVSKHLTASMPAQDVQNMKADFLHLPHQGNISSYSGGTAELEAYVVVVDRPLTDLEAIGEGFWPSPDVTRPELDAYAPKGKYDSVIVFWQASNPSTGQSLPVYGWGLGYWPFDYANGMTYATVFNISWVWPSDACQGEVFMHEWLHGVTGFYMWRGYAFPYEDLHGAEEAGYATNPNGCWTTWLNDYMRGLVYENGVRKALIPQTWYGGSITTYDIQGWRGEYYNNETLSGVPVLIRDDPQLDFFWELGSPHPLVNNNHFSTRWTKVISFEGGMYHFAATRDDGLRIWVDDELILDMWAWGYEYVSVDHFIDAGPHVIRVEMYEIDGWASTILDITPIAPTFGDVPVNYWAWRYIERLYNAGITGGCSSTPLNYCPDTNVTRAQMAVFLMAAKHGTGYTPPAATGIFSDVAASNGFARWIEQMANEGITGGCGGGKYCPNAPVTREQMAVFLLVAEHGTGYVPPAASGVFTDVPVNDPFAKWIEQLAAEGITGGCGGGKFCPDRPVTRGQMAVFLVTLFNLP